MTDGIRLALEGSSEAPRCAQLKGEEFDYGSNQETRFGHEQCRQKSEECREDCRQEGREGHGRQEEAGDQEEDSEKRQPVNGYWDKTLPRPPNKRSRAKQDSTGKLLSKQHVEAKEGGPDIPDRLYRNLCRFRSSFISRI